MTLSHAGGALAQALIGDPEFTSVEVADAAGVDLVHARRLWRALGFAPVPDHDRAFTRSDVAMLGTVRNLLEQGIAEPGILVQLTRVTGQSLARVAEAQVAAAVGHLELGRAGTATGSTVESLMALPKSLVPSVESFLSYAWRRHLVAVLFRLAASGGMQPAVGRRVAYRLRRFGGLHRDKPAVERWRARGRGRPRRGARLCAHPPNEAAAW